MTIRDRMDGLEPYKWLILENTPGIHRLMTAITRAGFSGGGRIRVRYEDCTEMEIEMPQWFKDVEIEKLTLLDFASAMSK